MLSAYIRYKFPNVIKGALSSSAPVAFNSENNDCRNFFKITTEAFKLYEGCDEIIRNSWEIFDFMDDDINKIFQELKICNNHDFYNHPDRKNILIKALEQRYYKLAIINYDQANAVGNNFPAWPIEKLCNQMRENNEKGFLPNAKISHIKSVLKMTLPFVDGCYDILSASIEYTLPWDYQHCSEFMYAKCKSPEDMFYHGPDSLFLSGPSTQKEHYQNNKKASCLKKYNISPDFTYLERTFGFFQDTKTYSNIIFTHGEFDPCLAGRPRIESDLTKDVVMIDIRNASHHVEIMSRLGKDNEDVIIAREIIEKYFLKWMNE